MGNLVIELVRKDYVGWTLIDLVENLWGSEELLDRIWETL